ncbi:BRCT domain-containing protein [Zooshikella harenae]|uniref:BRCT domain-containing protein n=1 Tax=Zooshikella harenae TaxID=2827238 RepID=A0ABS5Z6E0_9GAMM|nr:BRCT domain-containing protein [Zooshikella harenae]MBU2709570.1 BRCT domain-containing protein [Zooshikella harenae]
MSALLSLSTLQQALHSKDPQFSTFLSQYIDQQQGIEQFPSEEQQTELMTVEQFVQYLRSPAYLQLTLEQQQHLRESFFQQATKLPETHGRLLIFKLVLPLWKSKCVVDRQILLQVLTELPFVYGCWRAIKLIFKLAESEQDYEVYGLLAARIDMALANPSQHEVRLETLTYLTRRAWRTLRIIGKRWPSLYPVVAGQVLIHYRDDTSWTATWVANHILYHGSKKYSRTHFRYIRDRQNVIKHCAFPDAWQLHLKPLIKILSLANAELVRRFTVELLQKYFLTGLRSLPCQWLKSLPTGQSKEIDKFVIWLIHHAPVYEQKSLLQLGLFDLLWGLLNSQVADARQFAIDIFQVHNKAITCDQFLELLQSQYKNTRVFAETSVQQFNLRKSVPLSTWGVLLVDKHAHEFAAAQIKKLYTRKEINLTWLKQLLLANNYEAFNFAVSYLVDNFSLSEITLDFFLDLLLINTDEEQPLGAYVADFALSNIKNFDLSSLAQGHLQQLLLHPLASETVIDWVNEGKLQAEKFGAVFCQSLVYEPDWQQAEWRTQLLTQGKKWPAVTHFAEDLAEEVRYWLKDVRQFSAKTLGLDWLLTLAASSNTAYHSFAVDVLTLNFLPADFASNTSSQVISESETESTSSTQTAELVSFEGQRFLFTGKLATMTRSEAQALVKKLGGAVASTVNGKLNYLVIGDEGSPLYGNGKKGSKQVKAEQLQAQGADIAIISETAFLKKTSGQEVESSSEDIMNGCERLWQWATEAKVEQQNLAEFARHYLIRHHQQLCLVETDRPVDPGAEIPAEFLSLQRFFPLLKHNDRKLRAFALRFVEHEWQAWLPSTKRLAQLLEQNYHDVNVFIQASIVHQPERLKACHLDLTRYTVADWLVLCESNHKAARTLGLYALQQLGQLSADVLLLLLDSPDRQLRYFAIHQLWLHYRKMNDINSVNISLRNWQQLVCSELFTIPPTRMSKNKETFSTTFSSIKSKCALIATIQEFAERDLQFAQAIWSLLQGFSRSLSKMEREACLVALTRIRRAHPTQFA